MQTKGKSTTASLVHTVLKDGGVKAHLIGNIEKPALASLEKAKTDDVYVYELSSFQLEHTKKSPYIAVFLNLFPEHLNHHETFSKYAKAKANITASQTKDDILIFNEGDKEVSRIVQKSKARKIPFQQHNVSSKQRSFIASPEPALIIGRLFGISDSKIKETIRNFKPLPHRLEFLGEYKEIKFYNDSLATIPEATISAIKFFNNHVHTLIAGGYDRGIPLGKLADYIHESNIKTLILFPTTGEILWEILAAKETRLPEHFFVIQMQEAVSLAYKHTEKGGICLLSPAASSFNMFLDYKDRGEQFRKFVKFYATKK